MFKGQMHRLIAYFWHGDVLRSRSVSNVVLSGSIDVPAPPARLVADWQRELSVGMALEAGDVEALPLARSRARARWPDYGRCMQAAVDWTRTRGLPDVLTCSNVALMVCRGARYHHDSAQYGEAAFCNLFLSEDKGLDLHFAMTGHRIPLVRGTMVVFDTGQPHAVIQRGSSGFSAADFPASQDNTVVFLTWELPIENDHVSRALQVSFDVDPSTSTRLSDAQLLLNDTQAIVCPASGRWCPAD